MDIVKCATFGWLLLLCTFPLRAAGQPRTLAEFISAAKKQNPILQDLRDRLAGLRVDSSEIEHSSLPKLSFDAHASIAPVFGGIGYDSTLTNFASYSAVVSVSQNLFQQQKIGLLQQKRSLAERTTTIDRSLNTLELERKVTEAYTAAYGEFLALEVDKQALQLISEQQQLLHTLVADGVYPQLDYLSVSIARDRQLIAVREQVVQYRTDIFQLNLLCGIEDTSMVVLSEPALESSNSVEFEKSMFRQQFQTELQSIDIDRSLLGREYLPTLGWSADAGLLTSMLRTAYRNVGFSVGVNLSIPIFDGNRHSFETEKFDIAQRTIRAYAHSFEMEYSIKRAMLRMSLTERDSIIADYRQQLSQITSLIRFYKQQLSAGNLKVSDLLLAFSSLVSTQAELNRSITARLQLLNQLNYLNH